MTPIVVLKDRRDRDHPFLDDHQPPGRDAMRNRRLAQPKPNQLLA
ncbi:MAG: hypothetical protein ACRDK9_10445 [Solirubrobacterales bacterium]